MRKNILIVSTIIATLCLVSFLILEQRVDEVRMPTPTLPKIVIQKIKADLFLSDDTLATFKTEFVDYYFSDIVPRIENLSTHIGSSSFIQLSDQHYALWTEGVAPSAWGAKEFLYILSTASGKLEIVASSQLTPEPSRTAEGYHTSIFWVKPNEGCGYNDRVVGVLQYLVVGGSGSTAYQKVITYNRFSEEFEISTQSSYIFYSQPTCSPD